MAKPIKKTKKPTASKKVKVTKKKTIALKTKRPLKKLIIKKPVKKTTKRLFTKKVKSNKKRNIMITVALACCALAVTFSTLGIVGENLARGNDNVLGLFDKPPVSFKDRQFRDCVNYNLNDAKINNISSRNIWKYEPTYKEVAQLTYLDCDIVENRPVFVKSHTISDISEIKYFTNLRHFYMSSQLLKKVDFSKNTKLLDLYIGDNPLKSIDLSKNTQLVGLGLREDNNITSLNLVRNIKLSHVSLNKSIKKVYMSRKVTLSSYWGPTITWVN